MASWRCQWRNRGLECGRPRCRDFTAAVADDASAARQRQRQSLRSSAPAVPDRFVPAQCTTISAPRQRLLRDAENFGGEVSFEPPFTSFNHLVGAGEQCVMATLSAWNG